MKAIINIFLIILLFLANKNSSGQTFNNLKPSYAGHIEYASGNFGTYNYPMAGDSVVLYLKDSSYVLVNVFHGKDLKSPRSMEIDFQNLKLSKRKMYNNIVSIDKTIPTGNYDFVFMIDKTSDIYVNLTHFGDGEIADLTLMMLHDEVRIDNLFVAHLTKIKQNK